MPDSVAILRTAVLVLLVAASVALLVWLLRPKVRRDLDEAALIPFREEGPASGGPRREDRP